MRTSTINRNTEETKIELLLNLDGKGESKIDTGCGFFDHMLTLFSKHSKFDLEVKCKGDVNVDYHHTVEDIGIVLGKAIL
ncbi:MAG: imidazoleglycerol-phosphate dehydratase, partial [Clostridia bacterium]|nr:imidazoleglycerol-phosphate dehydratase [Clostridia bacterium]